MSASYSPEKPSKIQSGIQSGKFRDLDHPTKWDWKANPEKTQIVLETLDQERIPREQIANLEDSDFRDFENYWDKILLDTYGLAYQRFAFWQIVQTEKNTIQDKQEVYISKKSRSFKRNGETFAKENPDLFFVLATTLARISGTDSDKWTDDLRSIYKSITGWKPTSFYIRKTFSHLYAKVTLANHGISILQGTYRNQLEEYSIWAMETFLDSTENPEIEHKKWNIRLCGKIARHPGYCLSRKSINSLLMITEKEAKTTQMECLGPEKSAQRRAASQRQRKSRALPNLTKSQKLRLKNGPLVITKNIPKNQKNLSPEVKALRAKAALMRKFGAKGKIYIISPDKAYLLRVQTTQKEWDQKIYKIIGIRKETQRIQQKWRDQKTEDKNRPLESLEMINLIMLRQQEADEYGRVFEFREIQEALQNQ